MSPWDAQEWIAREEGWSAGREGVFVRSGGRGVGRAGLGMRSTMGRGRYYDYLANEKDGKEGWEGLAG